MTEPLNRRAVLVGAPLAVGTLLLDPTPARASGSVADLDDSFPSQPAADVRAVVGVSHFSLERVQALVGPRPELAKAAWDWGFGDWETALGAASHTGNHDIASYLIDNGARPDIFTAAMMGNLAAVRAFVEATPGIQSQPGPHGITLRKHAELGGDRASEVLAYLDEVGGADVRATNLPLPIDRERYLGSYAFGPGTDGRFEVTVGRMDVLMIQRGEGTARGLLHQGDHVFHPAGAPSARIRFRVQDGAVRGLEILNPELVVEAARAAV